MFRLGLFVEIDQNKELYITQQHKTKPKYSQYLAVCHLAQTQSGQSHLAILGMLPLRPVQ